MNWLLDRAWPDARTVVVFGPPLVVLTVTAAALAAWLRTRKDVPTPYTRKVFHFLIFSAAGGTQLVGGLPAVVVFGTIVTAAVLFAVWRGPGFAFYEAMARPRDEPHRTLFVLVPLATTAIGGLLANALFGGYAFVGYLVVGWGDAMGEPVGEAWGRHRYRVPSLAGVRATRSVEGSAAVFLVGSLAAWLGLSLAGIAPLATAAGVALAAGLAGAGLEAVSTHGLDNLTVQLAASGVAWWMLG